MAMSCDPCDCPEQHYRDKQTWRKAVITLLCRMINLITTLTTNIAELVQAGGQSPGGSLINAFTSTPVSHTDDSITGTTYTINHNLLNVPDLIVAEMQWAGEWYPMVDWTNVGGGNYGFLVQKSGASATTSVISVYSNAIGSPTPSGSYNIRFKFFVFIP